MASEDRTSAANVADPLLRDSRDYAFFQALRLLRLRFPSEKNFVENVRIRPRLGLGFPQRDIEHIKQDAEGRYCIEANFFGLYGVTSPLPTFYTEDLIDEQLQGHSAGRDFLDILHASLYPLLFRAWEKHRIWIDITERREVKSLRHLQALIGIADARPEERSESTDLLRYAGLFNQYPRSALGLQQLVQAELSDGEVEVVPCVKTRLRIDRTARTYLGLQCGLLGEDSLLGREVMDRSGSLDIRIGPLSAESFKSLLPGQARYKKLVRLVKLYLQTPLRCRLVMRLNASDQPGAALGAGWQSLGLDTWLGDFSAQDEVTFMLTAEHGPMLEERAL
ncbi:type VI secretion system baseplate subunit TssG [Pseudomonas sp. EA_65y_Pfl1_P113]|uniref:type VI secretion system baseplate subunit TssG n=1 Tax=Pseudomonas sp. EA_65y_Pfl1_P113 TaxID=3088692 RepID=UPI0030D9F2F4